MKKTILIVSTIILLAGCSSATPNTQNPTLETPIDSTTQTQRENPTMAPLVQPTLVLLTSAAADGQSGMATFTNLGEGRTKVAVTLQGESSPDASPSEIRLGTCARPGKKIFELNPVRNGTSETIVETPMDTLWTGGMNLAVYTSTSGIPNSATCGNLLPTQ